MQRDDHTARGTGDITGRGCGRMPLKTLPLGVPEVSAPTGQREVFEPKSLSLRFILRQMLLTWTTVPVS
jgi:hypothetical protein